MKDIDKFLGKIVKIFTKNGYVLDNVVKYEIEGELKFIDNEQVIIKSNGGIFLIFKTEISMVLLNAAEYSSQITKRPIETASKELSIEYEETKVQFAENGVTVQNQYGSVLPHTLLEQQPYDPEIDFYKEPENFSISAGMLSNTEAMLARANRMKERDGTGK